MVGRLCNRVRCSLSLSCRRRVAQHPSYLALKRDERDMLLRKSSQRLYREGGWLGLLALLAGFLLAFPVGWLTGRWFADITIGLSFYILLYLRFWFYVEEALGPQDCISQRTNDSPRAS